MNASFDDAAEKVFDLRRRAAQVQKEFEAREKEITGDEMLSDEGKRREGEENYRSAKAQLEGLKEQEMTALSVALKSMERRLDGYVGYGSADLIAFRDAHDRAESLTDPEAAGRMLGRALRSNDTTLAVALFQRALDQGWTSVTKQFAAENPDLAEVAQDVEKARNALKPNFNRAATYGILHTAFKPAFDGFSMRLTGSED